MIKLSRQFWKQKFLSKRGDENYKGGRGDLRPRPTETMVFDRKFLVASWTHRLGPNLVGDGH